MNVLKNIKLLQNNSISYNKAVIYDNKIRQIVNEDEVNKFDNIENIIDGKGMYLSPGFIDVHVHGCSSYDVMDHDPDNLQIISSNLARTGVTSFLPTTMTLELSEIENTLLKIRKAKDLVDGAQILGCHLEGPFISKIFKGAHDEKYIIPPDFQLVEKYADIIKIVTLAPELDGSMEFIDFCKEHGIIVSIGHTNATFEKAVEAIHRGARHFTHTFNAMTSLKHREPGAIGAAMLNDVTCEIIADNIHVHPAAQKVLVKTKGHQKVILITDAMRACLMCDGSYLLGGQEVIVADRQARLKDGTLAGSVLTLNTALKNIIRSTDTPLPYAIDMLTINPAKLLNLDSQKGSIDTDKDADFTIFDDNFNIHFTIVGGKIKYRS
jgi:N-acetylglucosamine-6-phosphate deacetylase